MSVGESGVAATGAEGVEVAMKSPKRTSSSKNCSLVSVTETIFVGEGAFCTNLNHDAAPIRATEIESAIMSLVLDIVLSL